MNQKFSVKTIVAIGIGAALFFVLARFLAIPSPIPNVQFGVQYSVQAFMSILFGPIAGFLIGFIGHMLGDLTWGQIWWSWVIPSGVFGLIMGLVCRKIKLSEGTFGGKDIIIFNIAQIIGHAICWGFIAPGLDILIYSEPVEKIFLQGLTGGIGNMISTAVVGTLLCIAYAKAKPKKGSLSKDEEGDK